MTSYRWTKHRVLDPQGDDRVGISAISMWRVAKAAAEEILTGGPLVPAWLRLFRGHLSSADRYWLRWQGDLAESRTAWRLRGPASAHAFELLVQICEKSSISVAPFVEGNRPDGTIQRHGQTDLKVASSR